MLYRLVQFFSLEETGGIGRSMNKSNNSSLRRNHASQQVQMYAGEEKP
jgi:hypothetical protein